MAIPKWEPPDVPAAVEGSWARAGQEDPNCSGADAYFAEGLEHLLHGRNEQAVAALSEALRLAPNDGEAYQQRASVWLKLQRFDLAAADATQAIAIDHEDIDAFRIRGRAWLEQGKYRQAAEDFDRLLDNDPQDPEGHYGRGLAFFGFGDFEQAVRELNQAIYYASRWAALYEARAAAHEHLGHLRRAHRDRKQAARLHASRAANDSNLNGGPRH